MPEGPEKKLGEKIEERILKTKMAFVSETTCH